MNKQAVLSTLFATTLFACSNAKDPAELITDAKSQIAAGNPSTAVISLKNVIQIDPKNAEARYLLGKIYFENSDLLNAEKEFKRATELGFTQPELYLAFAKVLQQRGQDQAVIDYLADKKFSKNEDKIMSHFVLSKALFNIGNVEQAKATILLSNEIDPSNPITVLSNALLQAQDDEPQEALVTLDNLLKSSPELSEAWLLKGAILSKEKSFVDSAAAYAKYSELKPNNFAIKTLIADNYIKAGDYEAAKPFINQLLDINANHPTVNVLAAQLKYVEGDYKAAKELADKALNVTNNGLAQMISGLSSYQLNSYEQAFYQLNAIADSLPKNHDVHKVLALLQAKLGFMDELYNTLDSLNEFNQEDASFFASMGLEYANKGDQKAAMEMFSKAEKLSPLDPAIKTQLGAIKLFNDDQSGKDDLKEALEASPEHYSANIALAMLYVKDNEIEKAIKIADDWLAKNPVNTSAMLLRGTIAKKAGDVVLAKELFTKVSNFESNNVTSLFNLAVIASEEKQYDLSNEYIDKLLTITLEYPLAYRLAISNALYLKNSPALEQKLNKIVVDSPDAIWPRIILARRYTMEQEFSKAEALFDGVSEISEAPLEYFTSYVTMLLKSGQKEKLAEFYDKWQIAQPDNLRAYTTYIDILEAKKDYKTALEVVNKALAKDALTTNFQLQSLEAYYLILNGQLETATQKVNRLRALKPNHAFVLRVQGQLALSNNQFDKASDLFLRSYNANQKLSTALLLVTAYRKDQQVDKAINFLEKQLSESENDTYQRLLSELYIGKTPDKALTNYLQLLEKNPNDVVAMNNLAWVYLDKNELTLARKYIDQAKERAPKHPQILDTYGVVLTQQKQFDGAIESLKLALTLMPDDSEIRQHLADAYIASGQQDLASQLLKK